MCHIEARILDMFLLLNFSCTLRFRFPYNILTMVGVPRSKGCLACLQRRVKVCKPMSLVVPSEVFNQTCSAMKPSRNAGVVGPEALLVQAMREIGNFIDLIHRRAPSPPMIRLLQSDPSNPQAVLRLYGNRGMRPLLRHTCLWTELSPRIWLSSLWIKRARLDSANLWLMYSRTHTFVTVPAWKYLG